MAPQTAREGRLIAHVSPNPRILPRLSISYDTFAVAVAVAVAVAIAIIPPLFRIPFILFSLQIQTTIVTGII
jgi:hypothetical protein